MHWHIGKKPNPRSQCIMEKYNLPYSNRARQIQYDDFYKFDIIFGMDYGNMEDLLEMKPENSKTEIQLLGSLNPNGEKIIYDPYGVSIIKYIFDKRSIFFKFIFYTLMIMNN